MPIENNLADIASRIAENLASATAQTTGTILTELMRHTASSYRQHELLLQSLQTLDENFLQNPDLANDTKTLISTKLMEEITACTAGFHNRVQKLLLTQGVAANFSDMLRAVRQDIVEHTAINNLHHTSDGNQVHAHNDFYTIASQLYDIPAINADDPYHGSLSNQEIKNKLEAAFKANYDLFGCLIQLEERLRSDLTTLGAYRGELHAYEVGSYTAFLEQLNKILEPLTHYTPEQVFTFCEDTGAVTDLHWPWVREKLYERLLKEHDFELEPNAHDFIRCFFQDSIHDTHTSLNKLTISSSEALHHLKALNFFKHWSKEKQILWINFYLDNTSEQEVNLKFPEMFSILSHADLLDLLPMAYDLPFFLQNNFDQHDGESTQTIILHALLQKNPEKFNFVIDKLKLLSRAEQTHIIEALMFSFIEIAHKLSDYPAALTIFQLVSRNNLLLFAGPILQLAAQHSNQALDCILDIFNTLRKNLRQRALTHQNDCGYNAFILAAQRGYYQSISKLLERGCDIESHDFNGRTALHWAAAHGHIETVRCLLNHGALIDTQAAGACTALHAAIIFEQRAIVELLLEHNADLTRENADDTNALELAIDYHSTLIEPILMHLATLSLDVQESCLSNISSGSWARYPHVLFYAAAKQPLLLEGLIEQFSKTHASYAIDEPSMAGNTLLNWAVIHGQRTAVELLLEKGADMNVRDYQDKNALDHALEIQPELIEPLLLHIATLSLDAQRACLRITPNGGYPHVLAYAKAHHPELSDALREKIETHHHMSAQAFLLSASTEKDDLMASIQAMRDYGARLNDEGASKGRVACALADALQEKVTDFFTNTTNQPDFSIFKAEFLTLLHSEDTTMSEYRLLWPTIIKNIAIALTGIGLVCIAGQLIYSQATQGRPLFFFQKDRTTCDEKRDDIEQSMVMVEREARSAINYP